ncbi:hypothetical protein Q1695_013495 [Nippostrongylus brasiliensis]|nr:hypothetical protein Q1695_013495 [Nippostrongylus brasiliensis]
MKDVDFEVLDDVCGSEALWDEWRSTLAEEGWEIDDSTLALLPNLSKNVIARCRSDSRFIGSVLWTENDGLAYIGFYIIRKEYRGIKIGSAIWKRAMQRIPSPYIKGLRSVEYMIDRYKTMGFPVEAQPVVTQKIRVADFIEMTKSSGLSQFDTKLVSSLKPTEFEAMLTYAKDVSGRDTSRLLRLHFDLAGVKGAILVDQAGKIHGFASATPVRTRNDVQYKIAPVYAEDNNGALSIIHSLLVEIQKEESEATAVVSTWNDSAGEQLRQLIGEKSIGTWTVYTLFSDINPNTMDFSRMFVAHGHMGHIDA